MKEKQRRVMGPVDYLIVGDIGAVVASLPNNSIAGLLLFENIWAFRFKKALLDAEAELIDMGRIPPETIAMVEEKLMAKGGA